MPLLITYQGRAVKRRRRVPGGILLTLYATQRNQPGIQILASEEDWQRAGKVQFLPPDEIPDKRSPSSDSRSWELGSSSSPSIP